MPADAEGTITTLLVSAGSGDRSARDALWAAVYDELHASAARLMAREPAGHTLQPTALVHEAYARLDGATDLKRKSRTYFFRAAAEAMRRILVEHARRRPSSANGPRRIDLDVEHLEGLLGPESVDRLPALDCALDALHEHDPRTYEVVMLRFFAGLTIDTTAESLEISPRTVKRCWAYGRAWLYRRVEEASA
jgi:RNA polymerase sigma factor (TIGR02999 family)